MTGCTWQRISGDEKAIAKLSADGADLEARDGSGRTPLHVAAYGSHEDAVQALAKAGADLNALEGQAYDIVTIAAVARDFEMVDLALSLGTKAGNVTSPYEGTALIASAHLGHHKIVRRLIAAGAPLDHINNLGLDRADRGGDPRRRRPGSHRDRARPRRSGRRQDHSGS